MKAFLRFIKPNLMVVLAVVGAALAIPALIVLATRMNAALRADVEADVNKAMSSLNGLSVTYEIPAIESGGEPWTLRAPPNETLNRRVEAILKRLTEDSDAVRKLAVERNSAGKELLIGGAGDDRRLFPAAPNESARVTLLTEFAGLWPAAHADLLAESRAGSPPSPDVVIARLEAEEARMINDRVRNREDQAVTEEESAEILEALARLRLELYHEQANNLTVYASPESFSSVRPWPESAGVPTIEQAWEWQHLYWIHQDIVAAIARANSDDVNPWLPVAEAPVKRLVSVFIPPFGERSMEAQQPAESRRGSAPSASASLPSDPNAAIRPDYSRSFTGRGGWPDLPNAFYDVRYATVTLVVDAARLPTILDAFSKTNLMTVVDLDVEALAPGVGRREGFHYGPGQLALATLELETIWIRRWMKPWMPASVRERLGIQPDPEAPPEEDA